MSLEANRVEQAKPQPQSKWDNLLVSITADLASALKVNEQLIRNGDLSRGWEVVSQRGAAIKDAMQRFVSFTVSDCPPDGQFAAYLLGGTGRMELCPNSDIDFGMIVGNLEDNVPLMRLISERAEQLQPVIPGLRLEFKANSFQDLNQPECFEYESLAAMQDAILIAGDRDFHERVTEVCKAQARHLHFDFSFYVNHSLQVLHSTWPHETNDTKGFHIKNGKGGLRDFQFPTLAYGFQFWLPSKEVYEFGRSDTLGAPGRNVLDAAGILLMARSWLALERQDKGNTERNRDFLTQDDFRNFEARFGSDGIKRLIAARNEISNYRANALRSRNREGLAVPGTGRQVLYDESGLRCSRDSEFDDPVKKFFMLYAASQRYGHPIEADTFSSMHRHMALSIRPTEQFVGMLMAEQPIARILEQWSSMQLLANLIPKFGLLEGQLYREDHRNSHTLLSTRALQRVHNLERLGSIKICEPASIEDFFLAQFKTIGAEARAGVRIALLVDELPDILTPTEGENVERYGEGIDLYLQELAQIPGISKTTLEIVRFVLSNKRAFISASEQSGAVEVISKWQRGIEHFVPGFEGDAVRALALFSFAAFDFFPEKGLRHRLTRTQWRNIQNFSENLLHQIYGVRGDKFDPIYFGDNKPGHAIGNALPAELLQGPLIPKHLDRYGNSEEVRKTRAHPIIFRLLEVAATGQPRVGLQGSDQNFQLCIFALDAKGLFWKVAASLHEERCRIGFTQLYNISPGEGFPDMVVDYISLQPPENATSDQWMDRLIEKISSRLSNPEVVVEAQSPQTIIASADWELAPKFTPLGESKFKFSFHEPGEDGMMYATCRVISEELGASIYQVARDGTYDWRIPRTNIYFTVPPQTEPLIESRLRSIFSELRVDTRNLSNSFPVMAIFPERT